MSKFSGRAEMYFYTTVTLHILEVNLKTHVEFQDIVFGEPIIFALHLIANPTYIVFFQVLTLVLCLF